jgi:hypothetical protein
MQAAAAFPMDRQTRNRSAVNRANAQHSTGPRTDAGKQRSSLNALQHGLTSRTAVLPSEDRAVYQRQIQQFLDEYQPATPTETQLVHELANTAWRLNRIPLLEADLLVRATNSTTVQGSSSGQEMAFDIVDAHRAIATLGLHGQRLSRQFQKTLTQLRAIQAERREREQRDLKDAAALLELHKHKGIPWEPADHGFVFSREEVERFAERRMRLIESRHIEHVRFYARV